MQLLDHLLTGVDRQRIASACGTSAGHINNIAYGFRTCSALLAAQLERATDSAVMRWDLRPNDWWLIWPELVGREGAPEICDTQQTPAEAA